MNCAFLKRCRVQGVLVDGVVTSTEKEELAKMRKTMNVNDMAHKKEVEAAGWSIQEFDQG